MHETEAKIKSFTQLNAWREAHQLVLLGYKITKKFPKDELFGLISQLRRAVVSVTSNIAEGFNRFSWKEKIQFFYVALSSLTECQNQMLVARDVGYASVEDFNKFAEKSVIVSKLINGLIKKAKDILHTT